MHVRRLLAPVLAVASAASVAACSGDGPGYRDPILGGTARARLRVVNATTDIASVQLFSATTAVGNTVGNTNFGGECVDVAVDQPLTFRANGETATLATVASPNLSRDGSYTVILYGTGTPLRMAVVSDDALPSPGSANNGVRFFNATSAAGDVYVTAPDAALPTAPSVSALAVGQSTLGGTAFGIYPVASTLVRLYDVGVRTGTPRVTASVAAASLSDTRTWTLVLTESVGIGGTSLSFLVPPCPAN